MCSLAPKGKVWRNESDSTRPIGSKGGPHGDQPHVLSFEGLGLAHTTRVGKWRVRNESYALPACQPFFFFFKEEKGLDSTGYL